MKELERSFSKSERIVAKAKYTYWVFLREFLAAAVLGGIIAVLWVFSDQINTLFKKEILTEQILKYVLLGCAGFVVIMTLFEALIRWRKECILTEQKFILRTGVLSVVNVQLPLNEIKSVETHQNMFQRLLGYGNLTVFTDAEKPIEVKWILHPEKFARRITSQKTRTEAGNTERLLRLQLAPADYRKKRQE